jgi:hypothetical protein
MAYVLLRGLGLLRSLVWLALAARVWCCVDSLLDLGLGRPPSRQGWRSARPSRSRVLWLLVRRLPCLLDVMSEVCVWWSTWSNRQRETLPHRSLT